MAAITFHLDVVSAEKKLFSGRAENIQVTGSEGELGIHAGHAPLLTAITPGMVRITKQHGGEEVIYLLAVCWKFNQVQLLYWLTPQSVVKIGCCKGGRGETSG